jgi:hypothetical protein
MFGVMPSLFASLLILLFCTTIAAILYPAQAVFPPLRPLYLFFYHSRNLGIRLLLFALGRLRFLTVTFFFILTYIPFRLVPKNTRSKWWQSFSSGIQQKFEPLNNKINKFVSPSDEFIKKWLPALVKKQSAA